MTTQTATATVLPLSEALVGTIITVHPRRVCWDVIPFEDDKQEPVTVFVHSIKEPTLVPYRYYEKYGEAIESQVSVTILRADKPGLTTTFWTLASHAQPAPWQL